MGIGYLIIVDDPGVFSCLRGFDLADLLIPQIVQTVDDPVDVLFDGLKHVGQYGGAARARDREEVGKFGDAKAQLTSRTICPLVAE